MNILKYIFKQFMLRITETSTWISAIALILCVLEFNIISLLDSFLLWFLISGIFLPEDLLDKVTKEQGDKLKNWLNSL